MKSPTTSITLRDRVGGGSRQLDVELPRASILAALRRAMPDDFGPDDDAMQCYATADAAGVTIHLYGGFDPEAALAAGNELLDRIRRIPR
jgi:hypothetical protein